MKVIRADLRVSLSVTWLRFTASCTLKKLSSESNNGGREDCCPLKARFCMASDAFFCHVLRNLLSEFDEVQNKPSLGIEERSCVNAMSVVIMSAEHDCRIGFVS